MVAAFGILVAVTWMGAPAGAAAALVLAALLASGRPRRVRRETRPSRYEASGSRVRVVEFRGYVYFDDAKRLLAEVKRELAATPEGLRFLVLDFRGAIGAERSAAATLARLQRLLGLRGIAVVYTGMGSTLQRLLQRAGCRYSLPGGHVADDLRRGLRWCDEQGRTFAGDMQLLERFSAATGDRWLLPQLLKCCEAYDLPAGAVALRGEERGTVVFVERGRLSAWQDLGDGDRLLLRALGPGALVQGSVLHPGAEQHPVVVVCETPARIHRLSAAVREQLAADDPALAAALERLAAGLANERTPPRSASRGRGLVRALSSSGLGRGGSPTCVRSGPG